MPEAPVSHQLPAELPALHPVAARFPVGLHPKLAFEPKVVHEPP